jgi:hypothetical protein
MSLNSSRIGKPANADSHAFFGAPEDS